MNTTKKMFYVSALAGMSILASYGGSKTEDAEEKKGPDLCTCVNGKAENDADKKACEEMEQEWKAKYNDASEEDKKKMQEEVMACESSK